MDKPKKERVLSSYDAEDVNSTARSQLRKRFDLGGNSSATTQPNVLRPIRDHRRTAPPPSRSPNARPTIPTPRARISLSGVPRRVVTDTEMMALPLDNRAAFVLMHIDGKTTVRTLVDVTGMAVEEVIAMIERLHQMSAISLV